MTEHDRIRRDRALHCDRNDLEAVRDAVRGLQSTDAPELMPLHDELMARMLELEGKPVATDLETFLDRCLVVDETADGDFSVFLKVPDCFEGSEPVYFHVGKMVATEPAFTDTDGSEIAAFELFSDEISGTREQAEIARDRLRKSIVRAVRGDQCR